MGEKSPDPTNQTNGEVEVLETQILDEGQLDSGRLNIWSTVGVQYSTTASPLALGAYLQLVLGAGGSPYLFWGILVAMSAQFLTAFSLAELAASFPHASGTVYWVFVLAPPSTVRFLSYLNGMTVSLGWLFALAGTVVYSGEFIASMGAAATGYHPEHWHVYLLGVASLVVSALLNTVWIRVLPVLTKFMVFFVNIVAIFIFVTILVKTHPKAAAKTVFVDVVNETGWSSDGLVFLIALLPGVSLISLFDGAAHLAEELPRPDKQVPQVMILTNLLNAFTVIVMLLALLFCLTKPENLLEPLAGLPILQLCWDAWPSVGFVTTVAVCYSIVQILACMCILFASSRLLWSFAKTGAFPFSKWMSRVDGEYKVPANAVYVTALLAALITLLVLGSSTVLNALFGSAVILMAIAYSTPIILLLMKGRSVLPEGRSLNLGRLGTVVNIAALCWIALITVSLSFPTYMPVTKNTMNWAAPFAIGCLVLVFINWFFCRKSYRLLHGLYVEGLHGAVPAGLEAGK